MVARLELCRLIARLDLPLGIGETQAWEEYIKRAHNPLFEKVSRQTTTRDMTKLFGEQRDMFMKTVLPATSSVSLTCDIWSSNAKSFMIALLFCLVCIILLLHLFCIIFLTLLNICKQLKKIRILELLLIL